MLLPVRPSGNGEDPTKIAAVDDHHFSQYRTPAAEGSAFQAFGAPCSHFAVYHPSLLSVCLPPQNCGENQSFPPSTSNLPKSTSVTSHHRLSEW